MVVNGFVSKATSARMVENIEKLVISLPIDNAPEWQSNKIKKLVISCEL